MIFHTEIESSLRVRAGEWIDRCHGGAVAVTRSRRWLLRCVQRSFDVDPCFAGDAKFVCFVVDANEGFVSSRSNGPPQSLLQFDRVSRSLQKRSNTCIDRRGTFFSRSKHENIQGVGGSVRGTAMLSFEFLFACN